MDKRIFRLTIRSSDFVGGPIESIRRRFAAEGGGYKRRG